MSANYCGPLREQDREAAAQLFAYSFSDAGDSARLTENTPSQNGYVAYRDGRLAIAARWDIAHVLVHGLPQPVVLNATVTAHPALRGSDVVGPHVGRLFGMIREQHVPLSGWRTQITGWWQRMGWSLGSVYTRYLSTPDQLRPIQQPSGGHVELTATPDDLAAVHTEAAGLRFGLLVRDSPFWTDLARRRQVALWRSYDGTPEGYVVYQHIYQQPDLDHRSGQRQLVVDELQATTSDAYLGLLGFLAGHNSVSRLRWDAPQDDPLLSVVREPRQIRTETVVDKVLRVMDVSRLELPAFGDEPDGLVFTVDDQIPWNRGPWRVTADGPRVRFVHAPQADGEVVLHAHAFGPLVSRYLSVDDALRCGLVTVADDKTAHRLRGLFPRTATPYSPDGW